MGIITPVTDAETQESANHQNLGIIIDELNTRSDNIANPTLKVVQSGQFKFVPSDMFQSNTTLPRNPFFDWTASKSIIHGLGYLPIVRGIMTYDNTNWWTLPQFPFLVYDDSQPVYYRRKPSAGVYLSPSPTALTAWIVGNFNNPLIGLGATQLTITYYMYDQPSNT